MLRSNSKIIQFFTRIFNFASFLNQSVTVSQRLLLSKVSVPLPPSSKLKDRIFVPLILQYLESPSIRLGFHPFNIITFTKVSEFVF